MQREATAAMEAAGKPKAISGPFRYNGTLAPINRVFPFLYAWLFPSFHLPVSLEPHFFYFLSFRAKICRDILDKK